MKNIFKSVFVAALALAAVACNKAAPEKSEVEAGFAAKAPVPTAAIDAASFSTDGLTATVKVSFTGITKEAMDSLSIGLVYGTDPTFASSKFAPVEDLKDGSYTLTVTATANTKMYFMASAANVGGTCYSEILEKDIPDLPFHVKVAGTYVGNVVSAANGAEFAHKIEVICGVDDEDPTVCLISGIEPQYLVQLGAKYPDGNFCYGKIDDDACTITIDYQSPCHIASPKDVLLVGFDLPSFAAAEYYDDVVFEGLKDGNLNLKGAFGRLSFSDGEYALTNAYDGGVTYVKQ